MRLWSLHPMYLDTKGLLALWREGLLAKAVLEGRTRGYQCHPQLHRFRRHPQPIAALDAYLCAVLEEGLSRGYQLTASKISPPAHVDLLLVTEGQLHHEWHHLLAKLKRRDPERFHQLSHIACPEPHPFLVVVPGDIEAWEQGV